MPLIGAADASMRGGGKGVPKGMNKRLFDHPLCCIGQRIVWQFRDKFIYLLSIYSQIRIFIEYGNKDTANT